jgi:hypothetical protein
MVACTVMGFVKYLYEMLVQHRSNINVYLTNYPPSTKTRKIQHCYHIILRQFQSLYILATYIHKITFSVRPSSLQSLKWPLSKRLLQLNSACVICLPIKATCPAQTPKFLSQFQMVYTSLSTCFVFRWVGG